MAENRPLEAVASSLLHPMIVNPANNEVDVTTHLGGATAALVNVAMSGGVASHTGGAYAYGGPAGGW